MPTKHVNDAVSDEDLLRATHTHRPHAPDFAPVRFPQAASKDVVTQADEVRERGNVHFRKGELAEAVEQYTRCVAPGKVFLYQLLRIATHHE